MKKTFVLVTLFVLPLVAYLFFASGVNNFGRLPILTERVIDVKTIDPQITLMNKITVLGFMGDDVEGKKTVALNLNQKIYKRFYEFQDFQFVMLVSGDVEERVEELKYELAQLEDISRWNFVKADEQGIKTIFKGLKSNIELGDDLSTPYVFIIDKDMNLRGRTDDEDEGVKYGFDATSVAELNNKMVDDVKIILAEYRLALKKNNAARSK